MDSTGEIKLGGSASDEEKERIKGIYDCRLRWSDAMNVCNAMSASRPVTAWVICGKGVGAKAKRGLRP